MPITPQARDAASKKRTREKHERWAAEMRAAGWMCIQPGKADDVLDTLGPADRVMVARSADIDLRKTPRQGLPLLPGQADPSALQDHVDRITGHPRMYPKSAAELREMARKIRAEQRSCPGDDCPECRRIATGGLA